MTFDECELAVLRRAVDNAEVEQGRRIVQSPDVSKIISIVENFIRQKKLVCYGGTAINNLLPKESQFYDKDVDIPDYDMYSPTPIDDSKELTDIYFTAGFTEVEAKAGQHHGTYKVFVNFIPVADISFMPAELFARVSADAISSDGILYAPPDFLRMSMYSELSNPDGQVSRWEKVLKRLTLFNKIHPMQQQHCNNKHTLSSQSEDAHAHVELSDVTYKTAMQVLIDQECVFFGSVAMNLFSDQAPKWRRKFIQRSPDFDVISEAPKKTAEAVAEALNKMPGIHPTKASITRWTAVGEILMEHYEVRIEDETIAFIYKPHSCHSYNIVKQGGRDIRVATIDTIMGFYLAFIYSGRPYYNTKNLMCMAKFLFDVQIHNRLRQKGVLKRFTIQCIGHQPTMRELMVDRAKVFNRLKSSRQSKTYQSWFLRYRPSKASVLLPSTVSTTTPAIKRRATKKKATGNSKTKRAHPKSKTIRAKKSTHKVTRRKK
jgi:hypothetical protein